MVDEIVKVRFILRLFLTPAGLGGVDVG